MYQVNGCESIRDDSHMLHLINLKFMLSLLIIGCIGLGSDRGNISHSNSYRAMVWIL